MENDNFGLLIKLDPTKKYVCLFDPNWITKPDAAHLTKMLREQKSGEILGVYGKNVLEFIEISADITEIKYADKQ